MNNADFIRAIENSFVEFIKSGTSRSNRKLFPLHGAIATDIHERLGDGYQILAIGFSGNTEGTITGRYIDKKVDITILKNDRPVCGIGVKFVMQNYAQNSNNYFENMLGETANIRCANCPYFQVFIIPEKLPYFDKSGEIKKWEMFSEHNIHKYTILDQDQPEFFFHSPNKILMYILKLPDPVNVADKAAYQDFYKRHFRIYGENGFASAVTPISFSNSVILNDYESFASKVYHAIMAL